MNNQKTENAFFINSGIQRVSKIIMPKEINDIKNYLFTDKLNYQQSSCGYTLVTSAVNQAYTEQILFNGFVNNKDMNIDQNGNALVIGLKKGSYHVDDSKKIVSRVSVDKWIEPSIKLEELENSIEFLNNQLPVKEYYSKLKNGYSFNDGKLHSFVDLVCDTVYLDIRDAQDFSNFYKKEFSYKIDNDEVIIAYLNGTLENEVIQLQLVENGEIVETSILNIETQIELRKKLGLF